MTSSRDTLSAFIDAAADAVARAIAGFQREAAREKELRDAEHRAVLAELRAAISGVRDGKDGRDGADGEAGPPGAPGLPGERGEPGVPAQPITEAEISEAVARYLVANPPAPGRDGADGKDGADGRDGLDGPSLDEVAALVRQSVATIPPPRDGVDGKDGAPGADGKDGRDGTPGTDGMPGRDGERGEQGPPGELPVVRAWVDGVSYVGDVVTHEGATWQARRDTGRAPPHEDWACIATAGRDGRSFTIRGTWTETGAYRALDVVALNGASFAARRDDPGPCPGDGWQMIATQGKPGKPGERGASGLPGPRGAPGPAVVRHDVDAEGLLTTVNADGSTVTLDLYPLLSKISGS